MENTEKIIAKIKKVLELSKNNPSQEEAKAAALKAQKLMAEYHITIKEVDGINDVENIVEKSINIGTGSKWKYHLAQIISKNFRCKNFFYGKYTVVFYGYEIDTEIAAETFKFLFEIGNKSATNFYNKKRNEARRNLKYFDGAGIKNCFLVGFLDGISEVLDKQCTALMIVAPKEINESYAEKTKGCKKINSRINARSHYAEEAKTEGNKVGRNALNSRQLTMA